MSTRRAEPAGAARASRSSPAGEGVHIAAGNRSGPRLRPGIVDRPAPDRVMPAVDAPVVLVSARAGLGKTALLALATRTNPPMPLGSRQAHRLLVELPAAELSLGAAEARALPEAAGVTVSGSSPSRASRSTEEAER